ncbi:hypothetical protein DL96DRAFT_417554 [Flagelloscypha sp. PMI_526]|nr:hypothetical protein DL96DRAFT_417554 [Flagelloscypha sp. PMI_526]
MTIYTSILLLVSLCLHFTYALPKECSDPPRDSCTFYTDCLEATFNCGPSGYPTAYGYKYCTKFSSSRELLSSQGVNWMLDTMSCLQKTLVPFLQQNMNNQTTKTCSLLEETAFESHSDCYVSNGLCKLPFKDWLQIANIVGVGTLFSGWDELRESFEALEGCLPFPQPLKRWLLPERRQRESPGPGEL